MPSGADGTVANVSITASDKAGNPHTVATGVTSYTIDNTPPTLAISDDLGSSGFLKTGVKPLITATFTETVSGISGTPTISIGTAVTNANMSPTANPLVWTYNSWTVPSGTDGTSYAREHRRHRQGGQSTRGGHRGHQLHHRQHRPTLAISDDLGSTGFVKTGAKPLITATFIESHQRGHQRDADDQHRHRGHERA